MSERVTIVGAGLAGSLMAVFFARRGYAVDVHERRPDLRKHEVPRGKSINLALSTRGLHALGEVGLRDEVLRVAIPMRGRMIHDPEGNQTLQPYGIHSYEVINSVSRHGLNALLMDAAEARADVRMHFEQKCVGMDFERQRLLFPDGEVEATRVIAADGVHSAVRSSMMRLERFDYHQSFLEWGYKELTMPPTRDGGHRLFTNALHIWPRHDFMLIALPNLDGSFTCTLFLPFEGPYGFASLKTDADVKRFFAEHFPDALPEMPTLLDDFQHNPTSPLAYVRCRPWHVGGQAALVGDACHAVVPFYGQGMNAAFEDCALLDECIGRYAPDWETVFTQYEGLRRENTDALADLSLRNFVEMRHRVVSPAFLVKKQAEKVLHRLFPSSFVPLYSMVTFSRIPYARAVEKARRQDMLLAGLAGLGLGALVGGVVALTRQGSSPDSRTGPPCRES